MNPPPFPVDPAEDAVPFVMSPSPQTTFLVSHMAIPRGGVVVDLGCGSGALAIEAIQQGARLCYAIDLNRHAIQLTIDRAREQGVEHCIKALVADFSEIDCVIQGPVDVILANPPQTPAYQMTNNYHYDLAYEAGLTGRSHIDTIMRKAKILLQRTHLKSPSLQMVLHSWIDLDQIFEEAKCLGFHTQVVSRKTIPLRSVHAHLASDENVDKLGFETISVLSFTPEI